MDLLMINAVISFIKCIYWYRYESEKRAHRLTDKHADNQTSQYLRPYLLAEA